MKKVSLAYITSLRLYNQACATGRLRKLTIEQYSEAGYERGDTGLQTKYIPEDITIIASSLFSRTLSTRSQRLIQRIIAELCLYNALWYFDPTLSTADNIAVRELRTAQILSKTEDARIHFVNPDYIRKGSKPAVLALTTKELEGVQRVSRDNIRNLSMKSTLLDLPTSDSEM